MSEFEVGDRVRRVGKSDNSNGMIQGEVYTISNIRKTEFCPTWLELENNGNGPWNPDYFELISKGDDSMKDVDAIAVEVDDPELSEAIQKKAFENGYGWGSDGKTVMGLDYNYLHFDVKSKDRITYCNDELSEKVDKTYQLPQDWNKVVEFLEQKSQPTPELNGREGEIEDDEVSIGCFSGSVDDLIDFKAICEYNGVQGGDLIVKGEKIELQELFDFIEDVKEVVENG